MRTPPDRRTIINLAVAAVILTLALGMTTAALGQVTITCLEVGPDVVCSSPGGPLSITGLTPGGPTTTFSYVNPVSSDIIIGPLPVLPVDFYTPVTPPPNFGTAFFIHFPTIGTGARYGVQGPVLMVHPATRGLG